MNLDAYEVKDIVSYLKQYREILMATEEPKKHDKFTTRNYDINRIEQLIHRLSGKNPRGYRVQKGTGYGV